MTASNGTREPMRLRQPGRSSGLFREAETPSSMNAPTNLQPRAAAYFRPEAIWRATDTDSSVETDIRAYKTTGRFLIQATLGIKDPSIL
jgi:hypothetical protein